MKFVLKPSLEHMALVKIGVSLWNQSDISALIPRAYYEDECPYEWEEIEEKVIEKVSQLSLPQLLKEKVLGVIVPIGTEISEWMDYYYATYGGWIEYRTRKFQTPQTSVIPAYLSAELCWTPQGTVDRKRTAEIVIQDENLDVLTRYCLACDYFLEDYVIRFWSRLPRDLKNYDWHDSPIIQFWSNSMKRGGVGPISYKEAFYQSVCASNKVAAKYFLQKLTPEEREESLKGLILYARNADFFCYIISELDSNLQTQVFKRDPSKVLQSCLNWPLQSFFIETANCMWGFLSVGDFTYLLTTIVNNVGKDYNDWNYRQLFREFWQKSPNALKILFIDGIGESSILPSLLRIKDKEIIKLILKDASVTAKEKLIYSRQMNIFCKRFIHENEWDFLEFCIRECLQSKNNMLKYKKEFEKHRLLVFFKHCSATEKQKWNRLFQFSNNSINEYGKRSEEEGESSSSKRFHNLQ